jgi:hypothetical protein
LTRGYINERLFSLVFKKNKIIKIISKSYFHVFNVHFFFKGNVVTIKLSENQENVLQNDGTYLTMIVETHFQMNYSSGEWKRINKYRRLEESETAKVV